MQVTRRELQHYCDEQSYCCWSSVPQVPLKKSTVVNLCPRLTGPFDLWDSRLVGSSSDSSHEIKLCPEAQKCCMGSARETGEKVWHFPRKSLFKMSESFFLLRAYFGKLLD